MARNLTQLLISAATTLLLFWLLSIAFGPTPPLGPFFSPSAGFWANAVTSQKSDLQLDMPGGALTETVSVYYDSLGIPHIFAQNDDDLYYAQGYVTARDRLWQMEFQTYAAAGRLSEIIGPSMLEYDRYRRRIGMGCAAEQALSGLVEHPETARAVKAYAAGVNARINELNPAEYSLEYKLLDYRPEPWSPLKTALLLKSMTYTLAGHHHDLQMSNTRAYLGSSFIRQVLDIDPPLNAPVIPPDQKWDFLPVPIQQPDTVFKPSIATKIPPFRPDPHNGSNNWAVSGSKTASGYPILANDPHLNMTLPSIWYAIQLHSPTQNVMGASLPGAPAVIVGFNEHTAWGTTNVSADVWDWYEIVFRDSTLAEYRYNGSWRPTTQRVEKINIKGEPAVVDTVVYTHHGPVVQTSGSKKMRPGIPRYHAMQWIAHKRSNELRYFLELNKARSYEDYREALPHFDSPAQNWVFADHTNIALTAAGKYPLKWNGQGRFIGDGSDPRYDWQGWIPFDHIPSVKNPARGFVSSANQDPTGDAYPYYLDDDFAPYERGRRINDRLAAMDNITPRDLQQLQTDTYSYHAATVLPRLLRDLRKDTLSPLKREALASLAEWDYNNDGELSAPSLFHYWWEALDNAIWDDEYHAVSFPMERPARDQTAHLVLTDSTLSWYDNITTEESETLNMLINRSFHRAFRQLTKEFGPRGPRWKWGQVNNTNLNHLAQIPGLGQPNIFTDGARESINAIRGDHGPSWRMVVAMGPAIDAYGIYPGGQSGNPGSPYYDNMIDDWTRGKLYPLWFMKHRPSSDDSVTYMLNMQ
ncbi:penicillin acylase family protein [Fodinibius sediminis]|uniref:Penicillin amidase n=1 Tax=Fodinibius sediminis TaxID=1214077 RepID=A0A521DHJ3_9BACT|nr:penicillin acylase family protein [Fodinibius sediminis]SMO70390.1 penicillin amidase [Fodinibius sediminis]